MKRLLPVVLAIPAALAAMPARAQTSGMYCPHHGGSASHHSGVAERGDRVMGFDHAKTTHHFRLTPSGGSIEVTANDPQDAASRDAIRAHLSHVAERFAQGDFDTPRQVHDREPPGVPAMQAKKSSIVWKYRDLPAGGEIRIETADRDALASVHEFLRFQIEDHETGDSTEVQGGPDSK